MTIQDDNERYFDTNFTQWRKSSYSNPNGNECVEVSFSNAVGMRDSHHPHGAVLVFDHSEWTAFLDGITAGEFHPT
jgi:uncharacterized protein DUF397